jgi:hypothetical protein
MAIMDLQLANNFSIFLDCQQVGFLFGKVQAVIRNPNELTGIGFIISSILSPLTP